MKAGEVGEMELKNITFGTWIPPHALKQTMRLPESVVDQTSGIFFTVTNTNVV